MFWSREAGSAASPQSPADGGRVPVRGQRARSFLPRLRGCGAQLSCPPAGLSMNQTAGVSNNVRCSSGKGPKVRAAAGAPRGAQPGENGVRWGAQPGSPPPLFPAPKPVAKCIPPSPGSNPLSSPLSPSLGEVQHLSLAPRRQPGLGCGASSLQRCSGQAGIAPRTEGSTIRLRFGEVLHRVPRDRGCSGLAALSVGTIRTRAPASNGLK